MSQLTKAVLACVFLVVTSCKSLKIDANSNLTKNASVKEIVAIHNAKNFKYTTLQSGVRANYDDGKKTVSPSITLRMEKDEKIWLSAKFLGFTVAKIYITPTKFSFYEKLNRRYYSGDLSLLEKFLGQKVSFEQLQNMFLGQSIIQATSKDFETNEFNANTIVLHSKNTKDNLVLNVLFYLLNAKVAAYEITKDDKRLDIKYPNYQKVNGQDFPEIMQIKVANKGVRKSLQMNFKSVTVNEKLSFPYAVPNGYTEFKLRK